LHTPRRERRRRCTAPVRLRRSDPRAAARTSGKKHDRDPRFSPDGRTLAFTSDREGESQIYVIDLGGGEARALTRIATGIEGVIWSPDGKFLIGASDVFPDCASDKCNKERSERKQGSSGRVIERLLFRHWDAWRDGKRTHLMRVDAQSGEARDLTPGEFDSPGFSLGGALGYDISPDGKSIVLSSNHDRVEAISTNSDLFEIPSSGGAARCLTCDNKAADGEPRYSPDGRYIAYRAQRRPGHESDRFELRVVDRKSGVVKSLTESFDDQVGDFAWAHDSRTLYFSSVVAATRRSSRSRSTRRRARW
jgi:Tol biopolymer transport system component